MRPQLFWRVLSLEARKQMSYRGDFWSRAAVAFGVEMVVAWSLWRAVFTSSGQAELGGFTFDGMVLYYVMVLLVGKLVRGDERGLTLSRDIYEGSLSRYLVYPASYAGFKYAENLGALLPALVQLTLLGALALLVLPVPAEIAVTPASAAMALVAVLLANLLAFVLRFPVQGVAFWADNVWSLSNMVRFTSDLLGGLLLPLSLLPASGQEVLAWLPFQYLFYFPVATAIGRVSFGDWLQGLGVMAFWILAIAALGAWVWRRGGLTYAGVGI